MRTWTGNATHSSMCFLTDVSSKCEANGLPKLPQGGSVGSTGWPHRGQSISLGEMKQCTFGNVHCFPEKCTLFLYIVCTNNVQNNVQTMYIANNVQCTLFPKHYTENNVHQNNVHWNNDAITVQLPYQYLPYGFKI